MGRIDFTDCENGLQILDVLDANETTTITSVEHKSLGALTVRLEASRYAEICRTQLPPGWEIHTTKVIPHGDNSIAEQEITLKDISSS